MNNIWFFSFFFSTLLLLFSSPQQALISMTFATQSAFELCVALVAVYGLWMGLISIMTDCGMIGFLSGAVKPLLKKLFKTDNDQAFDHIALNMSANLIGISNAATPSAICAIKKLDKGSEKATHAMAMLFVINCTSLQVLPTTLIGIRTMLNSANPLDIVLPSVLCSVATTLVGIVLMKMFFRESTSSKNVLPVLVNNQKSS